MLRMMMSFLALLLTVFLINSSFAAEKSVPVFQDSFDRVEENDAVEQLGTEWKTNSKSRALGDKQVDLKDGALVINISPHADHAVTVAHDIEMTDVKIELRFQLEKGNQFNLNFSDRNCKKSHAGHVSNCTISTNSLAVTDQLEGNMKNEFYEKKKVPGVDLKALNKEVEQFTKKVPAEIAPGKWHTLVVEIKDDTMTATVDGKATVTHQSPGYGHPTKTHFALSVPKSVMIDDVKVWK